MFFLYFNCLKYYYVNFFFTILNRNMNFEKNKLNTNQRVIFYLLIHFSHIQKYKF